MIGYDWFNSEDNTVLHEQWAIDGTHITESDMTEAYKRVNAINQDEPALTKTELHALAVPLPREVVGEAMEFIVMLDKIVGDRIEKKMFFFMSKNIKYNSSKLKIKKKNSKIFYY